VPLPLLAQLQTETQQHPLPGHLLLQELPATHTVGQLDPRWLQLQRLLLPLLQQFGPSYRQEWLDSPLLPLLLLRLLHQLLGSLPLQNPKDMPLQAQHSCHSKPPLQAFAAAELAL
jgi:hypothetical protein